MLSRKNTYYVEKVRELMHLQIEMVLGDNASLPSTGACRSMEALLTVHSVLVGGNVGDLHPIAAVFQQVCVINRNE